MRLQLCLLKSAVLLSLAAVLGPGSAALAQDNHAAHAGPHDGMQMPVDGAPSGAVSLVPRQHLWHRFEVVI